MPLTAGVLPLAAGFAIGESCERTSVDSFSFASDFASRASSSAPSPASSSASFALRNPNSRLSGRGFASSVCSAAGLRTRALPNRPKPPASRISEDAASPAGAVYTAGVTSPAGSDAAPQRTNAATAWRRASMRRIC